MANSIAFQTAIEYVESLGIEEQDLLIELIQKRRIENRRIAQKCDRPNQTFGRFPGG